MLPGASLVKFGIVFGFSGLYRVCGRRSRVQGGNDVAKLDARYRIWCSLDRKWRWRFSVERGSRCFVDPRSEAGDVSCDRNFSNRRSYYRWYAAKRK